MRLALLLALIGVVLAAVPARAFNTKAGNDVAGALGPTTPERIKSEAEEKAQKLQDSRPRHFTFTGVDPSDRKEFTALAKYMVYLFVVWTQKPQELPVKRVFIRAPRGEEIPVLSALSWRTPVEQGSATAKRYGAYRQDGYYLVPTGALVREGQIIMDLSAGVTEQVLVELPLTGVQDGKDRIRLSGDPDPGSKPNLKVLQKFIRHDFPGFPVPDALQ